MKKGRRRILLAAFAVASVASLTALKPSQGMCVKRNIMFWRTQIEATELRDNLYMLKVYGTDLINANTVALIGPEGVLLVDPGHPEMTGKQLAALPRLEDSTDQVRHQFARAPRSRLRQRRAFPRGRGHRRPQQHTEVLRNVRRGPAAPGGRYPADELRQ